MFSKPIILIIILILLLLFYLVIRVSAGKKKEIEDYEKAIELKKQEHKGGIVRLGAEKFSQEWPNISEKKEALPEAEKFAKQKEKLNLLKGI